MTNLIAFCGFAQSGKDTAASFLVERGWTRLAFADILRQSVYNLNPIVKGIPGWRESDLGWNTYAVVESYHRVRDLVDELGWDVCKVKYPEIRELLQRMGTEVGRELYGESFWVDRVMGQISSYERVVVTDTRFPNEEAAIHLNGGKLYRINRPGTGAVNTHVSDTGIDKLLVDGIIPNTGDLDHYREMVLEAVGID